MLPSRSAVSNGLMPNICATKVMAIMNLTPGDFKVVKDQYSFSTEHAPPHRELIAALEREAEHKQERKMIRGFGAEKG